MPSTEFSKMLRYFSSARRRAVPTRFRSAISAFRLALILSDSAACWRRGPLILRVMKVTNPIAANKAQAATSRLRSLRCW